MLRDVLKRMACRRGGGERTAWTSDKRTRQGSEIGKGRFFGGGSMGLLLAEARVPLPNASTKYGGSNMSHLFDEARVPLPHATTDSLSQYDNGVLRRRTEAAFVFRKGAIERENEGADHDLVVNEKQINCARNNGYMKYLQRAGSVKARRRCFVTCLRERNERRACEKAEKERHGREISVQARRQCCTVCLEEQ